MFSKTREGLLKDIDEFFFLGLVYHDNLVDKLLDEDSTGLTREDANLIVGKYPKVRIRRTAGYSADLFGWYVLNPDRKNR